MTNHPAPPIDPPEELARLREDLMAFYQPANSQERIAVERIALAQQSILRAARLETSLFTSPAAAEGLHTILETEGFKNFLRYQAQAERAYRRAVAELMHLEAQRPAVPLPQRPVAPTLQPRPSGSPGATAPRGSTTNPVAGAPPPAPSLARAAVPASVPFAGPLAAASRNSAENLALRL